MLPRTGDIASASIARGPICSRGVVATAAARTAGSSISAWASSPSAGANGSPIWTSQFQPYWRGSSNSPPRLDEKQATPAMVATPRTTLVMVDRTGTPARPPAKSSAIRTPDTAGAGRCAAASASATRDRPRTGPPARRVRAAHHAATAAKETTARKTAATPGPT